MERSQKHHNSRYRSTEGHRWVIATANQYWLLVSIFLVQSQIWRPETTSPAWRNTSAVYAKAAIAVLRVSTFIPFHYTRVRLYFVKAIANPVYLESNSTSHNGGWMLLGAQPAMSFSVDRPRRGDGGSILPTRRKQGESRATVQGAEKGSQKSL